ncbi:MULTISPECIES: hypothetical protein [Vibrio]|uniref:hypothetical protein n=1 Tax=Vibrio TaxID=662 RepID=UPI0005F126B1|nr:MULTISPECIES: hypothetical protein [Vibrio]AKO78021.1 hypothetical protein EN12_23260 [Vibrio cholerae]MCA2474667.1 hypothetical protein [Vibrio alginolyticus]ARN69233.1 hypothetical protein FORC36_4716 [Vibrio vulnificus]EGR2855096.1 hypothetical protein [Vibrio parahaemolyticus]EGR2987912.1 hypothetical protein [Vibrio parahaemolyticus]
MKQLEPLYDLHVSELERGTRVEFTICELFEEKRCVSSNLNYADENQILKELGDLHLLALDLFERNDDGMHFWTVPALKQYLINGRKGSGSLLYKPNCLLFFRCYNVRDDESGQEAFCLNICFAHR